MRMPSQKNTENKVWRNGATDSDQHSIANTNKQVRVDIFCSDRDLGSWKSKQMIKTREKKIICKGKFSGKDGKRWNQNNETKLF